MNIDERLREQIQYEEKKRAFDREVAERDMGRVGPLQNAGATAGRMGACLASDRLTARELLKAKANDWERRARGLRALAEALPTSGLDEAIEAQIFEVVSLLTSR